MIAAQAHSLTFTHSKQASWVSVLQILGASLFLAICSQISIFLPFNPVPLTGQTFGMMFVGAALGSRKGALSVLAYIAEGCLGLPFFAGGHFGLVSLFGPTAGYFLGFVIQAYLVGWFVERQKTFHSGRTLAALLLSCGVQMGFGVLWLGYLAGMASALSMGLYPFVFGEIAKALAVTLFLKKLA